MHTYGPDREKDHPSVWRTASAAMNTWPTMTSLAPLSMDEEWLKQFPLSAKGRHIATCHHLAGLRSGELMWIAWIFPSLSDVLIHELRAVLMWEIRENKRGPKLVKYKCTGSISSRWFPITTNPQRMCVCVIYIYSYFMLGFCLGDSVPIGSLKWSSSWLKPGDAERRAISAARNQLVRRQRLQTCALSGLVRNMDTAP